MGPKYEHIYIQEQNSLSYRSLYIIYVFYLKVKDIIVGNPLSEFQEKTSRGRDLYILTE